MDSRAELIEALQQLSHWSRKTAELLTAIEVIKPDDPLVVGIPPCSLSIDTTMYAEWPVVSNCRPKFQYSYHDGHYLIIQAGTAPSPFVSVASKVDVVSSHYPVNLPNNAKIVHLDEARGPYDFCICDQSLEFFADPVSVLRLVKSLLAKHGKAIVRFRPWTAPDGGYYPEKAVSNRAYLHLATQTVLADDIQYKVTRPLSTYDAMIGRSGLQVVSRAVHHYEIDSFFSNPDIWQVIKNRTWTYISDEEALKIMSIAAVDYVLQT